MFVRRSTAADAPVAIALIKKYARKAVPEAERSTEGFVQGARSDAEVTRIASDGGIMVAYAPDDEGNEGALMGLAYYGPFPPTSSMSPGVAKLIGGTAGVFEDYDPKPIMYGPAVVDKRFRDDGVLRALVGAIRKLKIARGGLAGFVDEESDGGHAAHKQIGFVEAGRIEWGKRKFVVLFLRPQ
jgi:hypothetical protein